VNNRFLSISGQIDQLSKAFENLTISSLPNYKAMCLMKQALINEGIPVLLAEQIVANMKISVSERVFNEASDSLHNLINTMAHAIYLTYIQVQKDFHNDSNVICLSLCRFISITLEF
jgi:hypothetical protein